MFESPDIVFKSPDIVFKSPNSVFKLLILGLRHLALYLSHLTLCLSHLTLCLSHLTVCLSHRTLFKSPDIVFKSPNSVFKLLILGLRHLALYLRHLTLCLSHLTLKAFSIPACSFCMPTPVVFTVCWSPVPRSALFFRKSSKVDAFGAGILAIHTGCLSESYDSKREAQRCYPVGFLSYNVYHRPINILYSVSYLIRPHFNCFYPLRICLFIYLFIHYLFKCG